MFISPLVVDQSGRVRVQNKKGYPVVQEGETWEVMVIRAYNPGRRKVQVARVEVVDHNDRAENLTYLSMPTTIEPDDIQLWYSKARESGADICARVTLVNGAVFESPRYSSLYVYMNPLDPIAGKVDGDGSLDFEWR